MLTKRQKEVIDFIEEYVDKKGYAPSLADIKKRLKFASVSTAHFHVSKLQGGGYLEKIQHKARAISITRKEPLIKIPLLGTIAAGEPIEAIRENEFISIPKAKLPKVGQVYALRVRGNSMIDENIKDGDVVLVQQHEVAKNGERVVALIDNYEVTLKKFYRERTRIRLQPANTAYEPIIIRKDRDIKIQGIVIDVIQNEPQKIGDFLTTAPLKRNKTLPLNKIILGDALAELKKLPDESCDVIVIDPPYNIGKNFGNNLDKRELGEYVAWCKEWINESIRTMKPTGTMFIYGFSEILAYLSVEIPINKRWLIWHYTNKNVASLNFWQRSHEAIVCAWKDKPIFNRDEVREPYTEGFLNGAAGKVRKGTIGRFSKGGLETVYKAHEGGALPRDVIKVAALAGGAGMIERWFLCKTCDDVFEPRQLQKHEGHEIMKHPTQKPLELSRKLIKSAMPKKEGVVLVPFVGTGSECVAAKELGQSYIGFEINPDYVRIAEKMIDSIKIIPKLF
ncbi:MAG: transcriptional repressor LexA [Parcubacteria group bacterium]|nr:transcriptional repressor LexA [Parcubacteria group bacterium]